MPQPFGLGLPTHIVLALVEQFSWGGPLPRQRAGLRRRHATASWAYLFRLIKFLSSSLPTPAKNALEGEVFLLWTFFD